MNSKVAFYDADCINSISCIWRHYLDTSGFGAMDDFLVINNEDLCDTIPPSAKVTTTTAKGED